VQVSARRGGFSARVVRALCVALSALAVHVVTVADVYGSSGPDGSLRYATQPLDSTYRLLFREQQQSPYSAATDAVASASLRTPAQGQYQLLIERIARQYGVAAELVGAVAAVESAHNAQAISPRGARGVMQLLPATAKQYGVSDPRALLDPERNIEAGVRHLKDLLARHHGNVSLALAAYNAGAGAVNRHGDRIPPYRETMLYVPAVMAKAAAAQSVR